MRRLLLIAFFWSACTPAYAQQVGSNGYWGPLETGTGGGGGGGFVSPADKDLDMAGFDLLSPGAQTFCNTGKTECFTLNVEVDGFEVADGAGTGPGNLYLQSGGRFYVDGVGGDKFMYEFGNTLSFDVAGQQRALEIGPTGTLQRSPLYQLSAASAGTFRIFNAPPAPTNNMPIGNMHFQSYASGFAQIIFAKVEATAVDISSGSWDGKLTMKLRDDGTDKDYLTLDATDGSEGVYIGNGLKLNWTSSSELSAGTDGRLLLTDSGANTGVTLDFNTADTLSILDQAGTGAADLALQTNGRLEFNGAGSTTYMTSTGPGALSVYVQGNQEVTFNNGGILMSNNAIHQFGSSAFGFWHINNTTDFQYEFWSGDVDGIGTNGLIYRVDTDTQDMVFYGDLLHNTGPNFGLGTDGRLLLTQNDDSTGVTLDFNTADTLSILDQAGTGAADLALQTTGRLVFNGAGGNTRLEADGTGLSLDTYAANTLVLRHASTLHTFYVNSRHQKFASPVDIELWRNDPSPTANDKIADINFRAYSDGPVLKDWGAIRAYQATVTDTDEDLKLDFDVIDDGSEVTYLTLDATDGQEGVIANQPLRLHTQTSATPTAPQTCNATNFGLTQVVNDSDDTAGSDVCYCGMTDDSTYDWLIIGTSTACPHY